MRVTDATHANEFEYATARDFCRIFDQDLNSLYLLSLLLAGDHAKAEQCFVGALENASSRRTVFKEWARSWARRSVIQSAQRMISPRVHPVGRALMAHSDDARKSSARSPLCWLRRGCSPGIAGNGRSSAWMILLRSSTNPINNPSCARWRRSMRRS